MNKDAEQKLIRKIVDLTNELNILNPLYNFRLTRGMCIENENTSIYKYLVNEYKDIDSYIYDYIRLREIELLIGLIKENNIEGSLAEVGVFQGKISSLLNYLFPERKLYLFDTFSGFSNEQLHDSTAIKYSEKSFFQYVNKFSDTSEQLVLEKMTNRNNCIICKGAFPNTAVNIDDRFCFVSIDVDFFKSTLDSLIYFYPKIVQGGYLFIHDYNDDELHGVKYAVQQYEKKIKQKLHLVPLCDHSGTLVISK